MKLLKLQNKSEQWVVLLLKHPFYKSCCGRQIISKENWQSIRNERRYVPGMKFKHTPQQIHFVLQNTAKILFHLDMRYKMMQFGSSTEMFTVSVSRCRCVCLCACVRVCVCVCIYIYMLALWKVESEEITITAKVNTCRELNQPETMNWFFSLNYSCKF